MKNSLAALAITLLVSSVASAGTLGLADSPDRYSITRNSIEIPSAPTALSTVESGDRIQANNAPVKVETTDGKMVLVGEQSDATLVSDKVAKLHRGVIVVTVPVAENEALISSNGLSVSAIEPQGATAEAGAASEGLVAMRKVSDEEIIIGADNRSFAVTDEATGNQVAMVGPGDSMRFIKTQKGWNVLPFGTKKSDGGTDSIVSAQTSGSNNNSADEKQGDSSTETKPRRAAPLILLGIGGAAVAGGLGYAGYKVYDNNKDNDDDDDDGDDDDNRNNGGNNDDDNNHDDEGSRGHSSPVIPHLPPGHHLPPHHHFPVHHVPVHQNPHHNAHHAAPEHHAPEHHGETEHQPPVIDDSSEAG